MFNRRTFMVGTGVGVVAGALGLEHVANAALAPSTDAVQTDANIVDSGGMAGMPGMTGPSVVSAFSYGGHAVKLTQNDSMASVVIDGHHPIHLDRPGTGNYHTHLLPFNLYTDPRLLVRDVLSCAGLKLFIV